MLICSQVSVDSLLRLRGYLLTQDDIDEILAGVGIIWWTEYIHDLDGKPRFNAWLKVQDNQIRLDDVFPSKREAAIAALVAGIERVRKERTDGR